VGTTNLNLAGTENLGLGGGGGRGPIASPGGYHPPGGMHQGGNVGRQSLQGPVIRNQGTFLNTFQGVPFHK